MGRKMATVTRGYPHLRGSEVSFKATRVSTSKVAGTASEAVRMVGKAARAIEGASKVPGAGSKSTGEVAEMAKMGCGIIMIIDQAAYEVHKAPGKASDGHSGNAEVLQVTCQEGQG